MKNRALQSPNSVSVVAGGSVGLRDIPAIRAADYIIGVDRGALWLIRHAVIPDLAIGDFDSVSAGELRTVRRRARRIVEYPARKDATDLELAVGEAIALKPREVTLFGVTGRRFDHAYAGIQMLGRLVSHNIYGEIVDNFGKINIVRRLQRKFSRDSQFRYLSVIALARPATVTLTGFAYEVSRLQLLPDSTIGISNEITAPVAVITVHSGTVMVIRSTDRPVG